MKLNNSQIKKAKNLLKILCDSKSLIGEKVYTLFESNEEAQYVCDILQEMELLSVQWSSGHRIAELRLNKNTHNAVKNNTLSNLKHKSLKSKITENLKLIGLLASLILNVILLVNSVVKTDYHSISQDNLDNYIIRESKLNNVIDSLNIENKKLRTELSTLSKEITKLKPNYQRILNNK